jgi:HK97 family phage major capsid protein
MNKFEQRKTEIDIELRTLQDAITGGTINGSDAKAKFDALTAERKNVEQQIAQAKTPVEKRTASSMEEIRKSMIEKRAITLNGTGAINQVRELAKELQKKTPVLEKVRYFYGPNASTNIPVLSPTLAVPGAYTEGVTTIGNDTQAVLNSKNLTPHAFVSILPVSAETITLGSIDFESDLPVIFGDAFAQAFHNQALTGSATGLDFGGLFVGIPSENEIEAKATGNPKIVDLVGLALHVKDYSDEAVIIMNPSVYAGILADATTGVADLYKEELIRNKTVEGVGVILTSAAPSVITAGSTVAVAGRLSDYGLALASEVTIEPIKKVGDTNTYFQAIVFANGDKIVNKNFWSLITK